MSVKAVRSIKIGRIIASTSLQIKESTMELDTHADTTVLGKSCLLIQDFNRKVSISGWDATTGAKDCPTVTGVVAYDNLYTCQMHMLIFHQAIYLETMENHLICPMQCRVAGVTIHDCPKIFVTNPTDQSHAIVIDADPYTPEDKKLIIPLQLQGVSSVFPIRTPSHAEFDDEDIPRIVMTAEAPEWDPKTSDWSKQEASMTDFRGHIYGLDDVVARGRSLINSVSVSHLQINPTDDDHFADALQRQVRYRGKLESVQPRPPEDGGRSMATS